MRVFLPLRQQQQQQQQQQQPHSQLQSSSNLTLHPNNNCNNNTLANNSNTVTTVPEHIISSNHENKGSTTSTATAIGQGSDHATTLPLLEQHNEHSHTATLSPISSSTNRDKEAHIQSTTVLPTHSIPNTTESSSSSSIIDNGSSSNSTILRKRKLTFPHQTHQVLPTTKNNCNSSNPNFSELVSTTSADSKRAKLLNSNDNDSTSSKVQPSHYSLHSEPTTSLSSPSSPSFTIPTTTTTMGLYNNSNPRSDRTHRLLDYDSTTLASSSNRRRYTHTATHNHDNHDDDDPALIVNTAYRANHPNHSSSSSSFASTVPSNTFCTNTRPTKQQQQQHHQTDVSSLFVNSLKERGLEMVEQEGDGNCLFRAVSLQVYGDSDSHMDVRKRCLDYMENDASHFSQFVEEEGESFQEYIERKRQYGQHGNNPEIQALSELFNRPVEVYVPENGGATPINIFHADYKTCDQPIRLSYHDGNHYNAVIDPLCPTAGLGLGLPGLEPGLADRLQVQKAVDESDRLHVQQVAEQSYSNELARVIQESKKLSSSMDYFNQQKALALSDFESEQEALISSIESYQMGEGSRKQPSNHHHHHHHHHRRRQAYSQQPQQHQRSRSSSPSGSEAFASLRPRHDSPPHSSSSSHVASLPVAAPASASLLQDDEIPSHLLNQEVDDEYPQTVQELVMNGFPLPKVLKAYELIGDRFDDLLSYLMSTST